MKNIINRLMKSMTIVLAASAFIWAGNAQAEEYPNKPVKLMVGWSAGGSTDVYARSLASFVNDYLGMPMVVVNKPGASGMIAGKAALAAPHDGYTLYVQSGGTFVTRMRIAGKKSLVSAYDDFQPLGSIGKVVTGLIVPMDSPFKSAAELVKFAKANPGKLRWANPGRGSLHTLSGMIFLKGNDITAQGVPFKGGSKTRNAVAGKQVDFAFMGISLLAGFGEKIKALGVTDNERDAIYKKVPTFGEQGLPQMGISSPLIIWGQKDLPADIVSKLVEAIAAAAKSKGYNKMVKKTGVAGVYSTPEEALAMVKELDNTVTPIIKELFQK